VVKPKLSGKIKRRAMIQMPKEAKTASQRRGPYVGGCKGWRGRQMRSVWLRIIRESPEDC